ncbi:Grh1p ASCRUDRAFT_77458 [Ascoidea rubescens DSM 1968]|uniref:PDZ GRASP-type domain-containing protein n=1 Tax=Ascoidea rubescens DSM 1968 TaxID=1344418 RepID=A0A1D2VBK6_9ASCO|nr:hypothetical protein ASCRUDRAFT_77458 [Ascoidea rubescens DSM 1968]ODV59058.1 hypothetical protein ASCRUDRAFT_77458 [Ascoidea rubescens DSM 1968]
MFSSFASKLLNTLEQSAETLKSNIVPNVSSTNDTYFKSADGSLYGFRVLHVEPSSPAASSGLEPWFDYIIGINNHELTTNPLANDLQYSPYNYQNQFVNNQLLPDYASFLDEINNSIGTSITLTVWSAKGGTTRQIYFPIDQNNDILDEINIHSSTNSLQNNNTGNNNNNINIKFNKIGISFQLTSLVSATYVYHVIEIQKNSPAYHAKLIPHSDYIIGIENGLLATGGEDLFGRVITSIYNRNPSNSTINLLVYNHDFDLIRHVKIKPNNNWGGSGLIGCSVAYGYLHRIPQIINGNDNDNDNNIANNNDINDINDINHNPDSNINSYIQPNIGSNINNDYENQYNQYINQNNTIDNTPFIPSQLISPPPPPSQSITNPSLPPLSSLPLTTQRLPTSRRKKRNSLSKNKNVDLSSYFEEQINKSHQVDGDVKHDKIDSLPPPPKKK